MTNFSVNVLLEPCFLMQSKTGVHIIHGRILRTGKFGNWVD